MNNNTLKKTRTCLCYEVNVALYTYINNEKNNHQKKKNVTFNLDFLFFLYLIIY